MKQRFSTLDVLVISRELSHLLPGHRVSNIYDLSSRIFLFKFAKPGSPTKHQLLIDCGFRCHLTNFSRTAASAPSAFVTKLRKVLKGRRVTRVRQVGWDRVIEITVGDGEGERKVFLEFFAAGNIIVTDRELNVVAMWREVREGDEKVDVKLGGKYRTEVKQGYQDGLRDDDLAVNHSKPSSEEVRDALVGHVEKMKAMDGQSLGGKKAKKAKAQNDLKRVLAAAFAQYPTHLLEHVFKAHDFDASIKAQDLLGKENSMAELMSVFEAADRLLRDLAKEGEAKGYIVAKIKQTTEVDQHSSTPDSDSTPSREDLLYDDFHPFLPSQFLGLSDTHIVTIKGFSAAVDEFYSSLESQKLTSRITEREETAKRKLETAKSEHEKRLGALQQVQDLHIRKAQAIEANTHRVEEACAAVNGLIAQGMDWMDIGKLIENEQGRNNQVASLVKLPLKLYENTVSLLLDEPGMEDEDDESNDGDDSDADSEADRAKENVAAEKRQTLAIDIDLALSPWANARQYYDQKRTAAEKEKKTVEASSKALKSTERKIEADLRKGLKQEKPTLRAARRQFFFEKFLYFISSDGYLVLGGKDAAQNEILYRRYLKRGDVYVHADLHGATSVVVKNNPDTPDAPIPPSTLSQAGALVVCTSSAWDSKAVMAAWWVNAERVSKTVKATGQYLDKDGDFDVEGEKNFLSPSQLLLGFGLTWLISENDLKNHGKLRVGNAGTNNDATFDEAEVAVSNVSIHDNAKEESEDGFDHSDEVIPDVEDAAAEDVQDDVDAHREMLSEQDDVEADEDHDDHVSVTASEAESEWANPLQSHVHAKSLPPIGESVPGIEEHDEDDEEDVGHSDTNHDDEPDFDPEKDHEPSEEHDDDHTLNEDTPEHPSPDPHPSTKQARTSSTQPKSKPPPRGKLSKAARAKQKKYANQDEEDRELALELLGSTKKQQQQKSQAEAARKEREEKAEREKERRRRQHERGARLERERRQRLEQIQLQSDDPTTASDARPATTTDTISEQDLSDLSSLNLLVPSPHPSDSLLAAIPTVAPWSALSKHKYKVKLQPGSLKKGKAVKEILGMWVSLGSRGPRVVDEMNQDKEKVWRKEVEKVKELRMEEVVGAVPVKGVRIVRAGGGGGGGVVIGGGGAAGKGKGGGARGGRGKKR